MAYGENLENREWLLRKLEEPQVPEAMKYEIKGYLGVYGNFEERMPIAEFRQRFPIKNPPSLNERT